MRWRAVSDIFGDLMRRLSLAAAMLAAAGMFASMGAVGTSRAPDIGMAAEVSAKPSRPNRRRRLRGGTRWLGQGEQERARRRRQIAAGSLTASNGLCVAV